MKLVVALRFLFTLCLTFGFLGANLEVQAQPGSGLRGSSNEGNTSSVPPGCSLLPGEYVASDKCNGGRCFVQRVNCCNNRRLDGTLIDPNTGIVLHRAESCEPDLDPLCRPNCTKCGDGNTDDGETCDSGNRNGQAGSRCSASCQQTTCGNGVWEIENDEQCDGSSFNPADDDKANKRCSADCRLSYCGDGVRQAPEACDGSDLGGVTHPLAECQADCTFKPVCGDGVKNQPSEACDGDDFGGPAHPNATCSSTCQINDYCGDGEKNGSEACDGTDLGDVTDPDAVCNQFCSFVPYCGDGEKNQDAEECDGQDHGSISDPDAVCNSSCEFEPFCGDGEKNQGSEACDGQDLGSITNPRATCSSSCELNPYCGDGRKNGSERCDGNDFGDLQGDDLECTADCTLVTEPPFCGDLITNGTDACDQGSNDAQIDYSKLNDIEFRLTCLRGAVTSLVRTDTNTAISSPYTGVVCPNTSVSVTYRPKLSSTYFTPSFPLKAQYLLHTENYSCRDNCTRRFCGDGQLDQPVEVCDDGDTDNNNGCTNSCRLPVCGDGIITPSANESCDGTTFRAEDQTKLNKVCTSCNLTWCGDGVVNGTEQCDENTPDCVNCQYVCRYYRYKAPTSWDSTKNNQIDIFDDNQIQDLSCLRSEINYNVWDSKVTYGGNDPDTRMVQLIRAFFLASHPDLVNDPVAQDWFQKLFAEPVKYYPTVNSLYLNKTQYSAANLTKMNIFIDDNCQIHYGANLDPRQICGDLKMNFIPTPISLIMSKDNRLSKKWTLANFELEPGNSGWMVWKASEESPLLVFNPNGQNEVLDGSQLFGSWTFGGRKPFGIQPISRGQLNDEAQAWTSGYQPLELLDLDRNGAIEGHELKVISLWFDKNQNAKADLGEMRTPESEGITKIFTKADSFNDETQEWIATLGYERIVDGKKVIGSSIDWTTEVYPSQEMALSKLSLGQTQLLQRKKGEANDVSPASKVDSGKFSGVWIWSLENKNETQGLLMLSTKDGIIEGQSVVEELLDSKKSNGSRSVLRFLKVTGKVLNGGSSATLQVTAPDGTITHSTIDVTEARRIKGTSRMYLDDSASAKDAELEYNWEAIKVED